MKLILIVGAGSFIGGIGRYLISILFQNKLVYYFPFGTLIANIAGCFLTGIVFGLYLKGTVTEEWKVFLMAGVLGGFTTFSSFSLETLEMIKQGLMSKAFLYIFISIAGGLLMTFLGMISIKN